MAVEGGGMAAVVVVVVVVGLRAGRAHAVMLLFHARALLVDGLNDGWIDLGVMLIEDRWGERLFMALYSSI